MSETGAIEGEEGNDEDVSVHVRGADVGSIVEEKGACGDVPETGA